MYLKRHQDMPNFVDCFIENLSEYLACRASVFKPAYPIESIYSYLNK